MKKNNNKPTFAARAKKIMAKYPRASFDKAEKEAMEMELDALIAEQEAMKEAMGMSQPQQGVPNQEIPVMANAGWLPPFLEKGLGYIGDAYEFINTGGGVLNQELYDPMLGSIPYNMGTAPVPGRGIKNISQIANNAKLATKMATKIPRTLAPNAVSAAPKTVVKNVSSVKPSPVKPITGADAAPLKGRTFSQATYNEVSPFSGTVASKAEPLSFAGMKPGSVPRLKSYEADPLLNVLRKINQNKTALTLTGGAGLLGVGIYGASQLPEIDERVAANLGIAQINP